MQEISLNILDLAQNSITAGACVIKITIYEDSALDTLTVNINDNGRGMSPLQLQSVIDPFYTTRATRKVGLGIPFFKMAAELTGGSFEIASTIDIGTELSGVFVRSHIDRMPLGDINATIVTLIQCNPQLDFIYRHSLDAREFTLDTREVRKILEGVSLDEYEGIVFLKQYLSDGEKELINAI